MEITLTGGPGSTVARVGLNAGETLTAEVGAMIAMDTAITVETTSRKKGSGGGGLLKGLKRMFSGESFFLPHFTSHGQGQEVIVGPALIGDVMHHRLNGGSLVIQGASWLASSSDIEVDTTWAGMSNALFSGEGVFWVKCTGVGDVLVNAFGAIYEVELNGGYTVDTGHIVAYEDTLSFSPGKAGKSLVGSFLGGEGLVCKFEGTGKVWCQTHNPPSFGALLGPKLKSRAA